MENSSYKTENGGRHNHNLHKVFVSEMTLTSISLIAFIHSSALPLLGGLAIIFLIFRKYFPRQNLLLPPGPKPWPVLGCLPQMIWRKPTFRWILNMMKEQNLEIMCVKFGNTHVIPITSPEIAREIIKKNDMVFASRPISMSAGSLSVQYLATTTSPMGEQWKKMRRIVTSNVLVLSRHNSLERSRIEEGDNLVRFVYNQCETFTNGGLVNVRSTGQHYCGNIMRKMFFGKRFFGRGTEKGGPGEEEVEQVEAIFTILAYLYSFCISDYVPFLRGFLDLDGHEKIVKKAVKVASKYQNLEIDKRIDEWKKGLKTEEKDVLDVLINLKDSNGNCLLSSEEIKSEILELMVATIDNPSNATEWALAEMLNKPEMLKRATEEIDRVVGKERLVQESDLPQLNYVKACLREAFRLHPIAPFNVPHVSTDDATVAGFFIPKGSHILLSRFGLGRNPKAWNEPLKYIPERYMKEGSEVVLSDSEMNMISFSTGRRGCPAILLGSTITTMLFARLLQGFTWEVPPNVTEIELKESNNDLFLAKPLVALAKPRLNQELYRNL